MKSSPTADLPLLDDAAILSLRGPRHHVDPIRPYAYFAEGERTRQGKVEDVATIFITNKECPFRCLMCDLWKNTTTQRVADGDVATQIALALDKLPPTQHVKLYNSGNFFDSQAIPRADWKAISERIRGYRTVIVECHPKLVKRSCLEFAALLEGELHVAMGLETVDPQVLPRLNKRMTLDDYKRATRFLVEQGIDVRAFILLRTPFQTESEGVMWAKRSIDWAFSIGVECCAVIPTREGNGAMEWLRQHGHFEPPRLESMEEVLAYGIGLRKGRVFVDLWGIETLCAQERNLAVRIDRLRRMNLTQEILPYPV